MNSEEPIKFDRLNQTFELEEEIHNLKKQLQAVAELLDQGKIQEAYDMARDGELDTKPCPALNLPVQTQMSNFAEAFAKMINRMRIAACWTVFGTLPDGSTQMVMGGHEMTQQILRAKMGLQPPPEGVKITPNERCVKCQGRIPPGKAGRMCANCRSTMIVGGAAPKLYLPPGN